MTRVSERFTPGSTVVREFVHRQRVWTAIPTRVIADTGRLVVVHWPGTTVRVPASYTGALAGTRSRLDVVEDLAAGQWRMVSHVWSTLTMLTIMTPGEWFSVAAIGRRVGFIDSWRHRHVQEARDRAVQMVAGGSGPFGEGWENWRPRPDWSTPRTVPDG